MTTNQPPEGTRLVIVTDNLLDFIGTRSERGNRLSFEWGEPDEHGWYTPTITEHADDNLAQAERERLRLAVEGIDFAKTVSLLGVERLRAAVLRLLEEPK